MVKRLTQGMLRVLFWTYERGSWQYDIICVLILAFIFLTPKTIFDSSAVGKEKEAPGIEEKKKQPEKIGSIDRTIQFSVANLLNPNL